MTDVHATDAANPEPEVVKSFTIALKGGCGSVTLEDADALPIEMYRLIFQTGLDTLVNSVGMSKKLPGITKLEGADAEKAKEAVRKQAKENIQALLDGSIKVRGKTTGAAKVSGAVETEALRLAKDMVKDHIRSQGQKIGAYKASEITKAAKDVLRDNPSLLKKAEANLKDRENAASNTKSLDLGKLFGAKASSDEVKAKPKGEGLKKAREAKEEKAGTATKTKPAQAPVAAKAKPKGGESHAHGATTH